MKNSLWERLPSRDKETALVSPSTQKQAKFPKVGSKQLRKGRISQKDAFYFITCRCYRKQKVFINKENCDIFFETLDWLELNHYINNIFCMIMPNHIHLVFQLIGDKSLSETIKSLKQYSSTRIKKRMNLNEPVWQPQYYDHNIRKDESLNKIIEYCWYNPVRIGLVTTPKEYPFWKSKYELE